jgi:hypothetical protein
VSEQSRNPGRRVHRKKNPEDLIPKEERDRMSRENGRMNDGTTQRENGKMLGISNAERHAIRHLRETRALDAATKLGQSGFRIRGDIKGGEAREAAVTLGEISLVRMTDALMGKVSKDKINAVLKASVAVREEICDPLVKESKITGALTLEQLVSQAAAKAREMKGDPALPPGEPKGE